MSGRLRAVRTLPALALLAAIGCSQATPPSAPAAAPPADDATAVATDGYPPPGPPSAPPAAVQSTIDLLDAVLLKEDTLDSTRARLGEDNVVAEQVPGAEGEMFPGWIVYPNDPRRRITVFLDPGGVHPVLLQVDADAVDWHRGDGVAAGMDSNRLAELNGGPFAFFGFDWDYGGAVVDWQGGRLAPGGESAGPVQLCPPEFAGDYPEGYPVGDSQFASDLAVVVAHPPTVCRLGYVLAPPAGDDDH